jgi:hypothetical protein
MCPNHTTRTRIPKYQATWAWLLIAYGQNCVYCHNRPATQIDHVIPYSYIRTHVLENLRPACQWCNLLASDKVFETFEDKYNYLREQRTKPKHKKGYALVCSSCLIPYYSAMHRSALLCPRCMDLEYETTHARKKAWRDWLVTLELAGIESRAHFALGDWAIKHANMRITMDYRISKLVEFCELYRSEFAAEVWTSVSGA